MRLSRESRKIPIEALKKTDVEGKDKRYPSKEIGGRKLECS